MSIGRSGGPTRVGWCPTLGAHRNTLDIMEKKNRAVSPWSNIDSLFFFSFSIFFKYIFHVYTISIRC